ncbi:hypothetical protein [Aureibacter tunicatorum]|uniref:Phosphohydrolase n=1 Tax=Aureibacter tunicatorum TaxID=866807 RepID=A0AAE3XR18_9BACT|nr:hypothetical protein [Aureibacter tunicatorum]MDR6240434.1 hypothetical protein [Aureibacter tunicatorum]BDD05687.1 hypothetical protein AUTU_31700 [Aureibacter tunicatorum]
MSGIISTYSKKFIKPLDPSEDSIAIEDIAHALSMMCRANGHFPEFYSVGQHAIFCCEESIERGYDDHVSLACLLHDGSEAYLADITRPIKAQLGNYLEIEERLQEKIYGKYLSRGLSEEDRDKINSVDNTLLYHEFKHYMNMEMTAVKGELYSSPLFQFEDFGMVKQRFLSLFERLRN